MQRQETGVTFKGSPMTLLGESLKVGQHAPEFNLHYYEGGLKSLTLDDLKGKPSLVIPRFVRSRLKDFSRIWQIWAVRLTL